MKKSKEAKFFCESCGNEVPKNARVCPTCGKFFASVRCPQCGKTGSTEEFQSGCPDCGYAVQGSNSKNYSNFEINGKKSKKAIGNSGFDLFSSFKSKNNSSQNDSSLPVWIYVICVVILLALVVLLYSCL